MRGDSYYCGEAANYRRDNEYDMEYSFYRDNESRENHVRGDRIGRAFAGLNLDTSLHLDAWDSNWIPYASMRNESYLVAERSKRYGE